MRSAKFTKKILIVDDLRPIVEEEKNILSRSGFSIFTATSGEEALKIHRAEKVDLIISDLNMPGMGGDELCSIIKRDDSLKNVSIIIICFNKKSEIEKCEACGANSFITKPIKPEELFRKVSGFLDAPEREGLRVLVKVTVKGAFKADFFFSTSRNISTSGILLETDKVLAKGDTITCSFFLNSKQITTDGEVMRVVKKSSDSYNYGVKFIDIAYHSKAPIEEFIRKRQSQSGF